MRLARRLADLLGLPLKLLEDRTAGRGTSPTPIFQMPFPAEVYGLMVENPKRQNVSGISEI
jgi:hypothetical protein